MLNLSKTLVTIQWRRAIVGVIICVAIRRSGCSFSRMQNLLRRKIEIVAMQSTFTFESGVASAPIPRRDECGVIKQPLYADVAFTGARIKFRGQVDAYDFLERCLRSGARLRLDRFMSFFARRPASFMWINVLRLMRRIVAIEPWTVGKCLPPTFSMWICMFASARVFSCARTGSGLRVRRKFSAFRSLK